MGVDGDGDGMSKLPLSFSLLVGAFESFLLLAPLSEFVSGRRREAKFLGGMRTLDGGRWSAEICQAGWMG